MSVQYILKVITTKDRQVHRQSMKVDQAHLQSGKSLFYYLAFYLNFEQCQGVDAWYVVNGIDVMSISVYRPRMDNVIDQLQKLLDEMKNHPQTGVWTIYLYKDDGSGTLPALTPAKPQTPHETSLVPKRVNADLHLPCFMVPKWRYIALEPHQRKKLASEEVDKIVESWNLHNKETGMRIWLWKENMSVETFIQQKEDIQTKVAESDKPSGVMCMHPPDNAKALLRPANDALDSLYANIELSAQKFNDYLPVDKRKGSYTHTHNGLSAFNYNSPPEYIKHGRVSSPKDFRGFLKSEPKFAALEKFMSIYIHAIARYFCGSADATPENIARIERIMDDEGDMGLIKYVDKLGMEQHMDNSLRSDATVFTIGIGRDVVYDMSRAFGRTPGTEAFIVRSSNPEGTMVVLDGESRYMWTHGVPYSRQHSGVKYTIHICFFHNANLTARIGYCKELAMPMYRSIAYVLPLHRTQSSPATKTHSNPHIGAQYASLLKLLAQFQTPHMPDRIRRPGLPPVHPRPGWI